MNLDEVIEELTYLRKIYGGDVECKLVGDYVGSDSVDAINFYGTKIIIYNKKDNWTKNPTWNKLITDKPSYTVVFDEDLGEYQFWSKVNHSKIITISKKLMASKADVIKKIIENKLDEINNLKWEV